VRACDPVTGEEEAVDAAVSIPGAQPWSATGWGERARTGVIVVHGFTGNPIGTRPLGEALADEGYTVEVPLLPGHGTSHQDLARTTYADWSGAVEGLIDDLRTRCDRVALIGHSMGGTISLDLAVRRAEDVAAVVVINPTVRAPAGLLPRLSGVLQYVLPYVPRDLAGLPTNDLVRDDVDEGSYALVSARAARSLLRELDRVRLSLLDLTAPLLVVRSVEDHSVAPTNSRDVLELTGSRDLRELVCERSYHAPHLDHDAALVTATITAFLDDVLGPAT
jgi:carboxylesterase